MRAEDQKAILSNTFHVSVPGSFNGTYCWVSGNSA